MRRIALAALLMTITLRAEAAEAPALRAARVARESMDRAAKAKPAALYLKTGTPRRVDASLAFAIGGSKVMADEWVLFAGLPPELSGQRGVTYKATPDVTEVAEPAGLKQPLLM